MIFVVSIVWKSLGGGGKWDQKWKKKNIGDVLFPIAIYSKTIYMNYEDYIFNLTSIYTIN